MYKEAKKVSDAIKKLIKYHGENETKIICIEELAELQKEVCKDIRNNLRREKLVEEMADVIICLGMLEVLHDISNDELITKINKKMKRNIERIGKEWN